MLIFEAEPLACAGICEVDDSHAGLPHIALENRAVLIFDEVAFFCEFLENRSALSDIGVYPYADL